MGVYPSRFLPIEKIGQELGCVDWSRLEKRLGKGLAKDWMLFF
jgi:hypothetical protein